MNPPLDRFPYSLHRSPSKEELAEWDEEDEARRDRELEKEIMSYKPACGDIFTKWDNKVSVIAVRSLDVLWQSESDHGITFHQSELSEFCRLAEKSLNNGAELHSSINLSYEI